MATLYREHFPLGWTPNADNINGDPNGLLRADNLTADADGVLSLIRGTKKISSGSTGTIVKQIFSKNINLENLAAGYPSNARVRYLVDGTNVIRNYSPATKSETIFDLGVISGGGDQGAGFGFGNGHVFIIYGTKKIKDDGINQTPIGLPAAVIPVISVNTPPEVKMRSATTPYSEWQAWENDSIFDNTSAWVEIDSDPTTNRAIAIAGQFVVVNFDGNKLGGIVGTGTSEDIFQVSVRIGDTSKLVKIKIDYLLQPPTVPGFTPDATDYYSYEWNAQENRPVFVEPVPPDELNWEDRVEFIERARREFEASNPIKYNSTLNLGINTWSNLTCKRGDFIRTGIDDSLTWSNIQGMRYTFVTTEQQTFAFTDPKFLGGDNGPLNGQYVYLQVDVQDNGYYTEKSLPSAVTAPVNAIKASTHVSPGVCDSNANECWIFRASEKTGGFYRVRRITGAKGFHAAAFDDTYSDTDALRDNIRLDDFQSNLPDGVIGIVCNFKGRNWYITYENIYPSYRDNFSSYDTRYVLETSGNTEYNLFLTKLNNDTMVLATNNDFYEITGSAGVITNGDIELFDLQIRPMGIKTPSISKEFAVREGNLFYRAADGIRVLAGTSCQLLSNNIDLLFRDFTCHGISPSINEPLELYYIGISKGQLYYSTAQKNNVRALYVYSFADQRWRYEEHGNTEAISALFVEEDDTIIFTTALFGDKYLRQLDVGTLLDNANNIPFKFLTVFDHNNQPRNRKDSYTLKITADTGNVAVNVILRGYRDDKTVVSYNTTAAFDGRTEKQFAIYTDIATVKYYQLELNGTVPTCKIYNFSIDYEPRPEQLTNLRIPPNNYGIAGKKRVNEIPMIIDTLGNTLTFTPILDGVIQPVSTLVTNDKTVYTHAFSYETSAFNIGGLISGGLFEFYELIQPREIELLPDPIKYKFVNYNNLGTPSRKRFIQYAIIINTNGKDVYMSPFIDGTQYAGLIINNNRKSTVVYTFYGSFPIGIDIACILQGSQVASDPGFEFFGVDLNESISEKLPPKTRFLTLPSTNYGVAAKKRIRTIPMVIDTGGFPVTYTPIVDKISYPSTVFNTNGKTTVLHYFEHAAIEGGTPFGIDYGGTITGGVEFEFYELLQPENVETLPVAKKFDQFGPIEFSKVGKVREISIRMVATGIDFNYRIYSSDSRILQGIIPTTPNVEKTYVISVPKGINPNIFRMEIDSNSIFHRFDAEVKVNIDGAQTANKRIKIK